jgi:hypothetical protein
MCYGYGSIDLQPIGVGNTIFPYTDKIGFWVQVQNPADANFRMIWIDPSGNQFRNSAIEVIEKTDSDWGIVFDTIGIAETTAKNKLGVWNVELYVDGEIAKIGQFQIIDYGEIQDQITSLVEDYTDLVDHLDELRSERDTIEESYEALQAQYDALEAQVGTQSDYEDLQDSYDELVEDYDALKDSQASTRTMLYAAIIVALVAVVVAVYFGVMKK